MKVGFVAGAFDLLHAGHVHLLRECKKRCDELIVGLHVDPSVERTEKNKPVESVVERQIKLIECASVDNVWIYETEEELALLLDFLKPDVRFLGSDYLSKKKNITVKSLIPIEYIKSIDIHTSDIRERIKNDH